jgi:UDP-glucuronate decarboxylase
MRQLAETICRLSGTEARVRYQPLPQDDPARRKPDISKAKALLGWEPTVNLEDGLARTIAYFRGRHS